MFQLESVYFLTDKMKIMRKNVAIFCLLFSIVGCNDNIIEKPNNLIEKDKMITILYDMSLLESIKTQNIKGGISDKSVSDYIYKKYKIDSIQLDKSNKYYASDIEEYKKMIESVKAKLNNETLKIDGKLNQKGEKVTPGSAQLPISDTPQVQ
jgi:hypothetical protein